MLLQKSARELTDDAVGPALVWLEDDNNHIVTLADSEYPQALLNIPDPPLLLYVKGRLDLLNQAALAWLAVVAPHRKVSITPRRLPNR